MSRITPICSPNGQCSSVASPTERHGSVAKRSTLEEYRVRGGDARQHVDALSSALAAFGKLARCAIEETAMLGDQATSDVFTEISRGVGQVAVDGRGAPARPGLRPFRLPRFHRAVAAEPPVTSPSS